MTTPIALRPDQSTPPRFATDPEWLAVEAALNRIAATPVERRVAALTFRIDGPAYTRRLIASFRDQGPEQRQLKLWRKPCAA